MELSNLKAMASFLKSSYAIVINSKYTCLTRLDVAWVLYQFISFLPIFIFGLYRFYHQIRNEEYPESQKPLPKSCIEYFMKFNSFMYLLFYVPQTIARLTIKYDSDNVLLIVHHILTFYGAVSFMLLPYYPWFSIAPLAFHSLLLLLPDYIKLYYIYIILIIMCYYGMGLHPYNQRKQYKEIRRYLFLLSVVLVIMWATGFRNDIIITMIEK